jgi:hypothetical protein
MYLYAILMSLSQALEQKVTSAVPSMKIKDTGEQGNPNRRIDGATFGKFACVSTAGRTSAMLCRGLKSLATTAAKLAWDLKR